jgi:hypothetical protein
MKSLRMIACLLTLVVSLVNTAQAVPYQIAAESFVGASKGNFETSAFSLTMELSFANERATPQATVEFSSGSRVETPAPRELKLQDAQIAFSVLLDGLELKFSGALQGNTLGGAAGGFRNGAKVGAGKWQLTRVTNPAVTAAATASSAPAPSATNDAEVIKQVIQRYLDVTEKKDEDAIKQAFHPDTKLLSVGRNGLNQMSLEEWWSRVSRIPGQVSRKSEVTILEISGLAAVVRIDFGASKDYVTLLKINGTWKIVNKVLSTSLN